MVMKHKCASGTVDDPNLLLEHDTVPVQLEPAPVLFYRDGMLSGVFQVGNLKVDHIAYAQVVDRMADRDSMVDYVLP